MCKALDVSRSGLDDWSKRDKAPDHQELRACKIRLKAATPIRTKAAT
jgi:hypothetical protein